MIAFAHHRRAAIAAANPAALTAATTWAAIKAAIEAVSGALTVAQNNAGYRRVQDAFGLSNPAYATFNTWNRHAGFYGILGGTAAAHALNWKDPRSVPAAGQLTYYGSGTTHSANGILWSGGGYADTNLMPDLVFTLAGGTSMGVYNRTLSAAGGDRVDMGVFHSATSKLLLSVQNTSSGAGKALSRNLNNLIVGTTTDGLGYYQSVRRSNTDHSLYHRLVQEVSGGDGTGDLPPLPIWVGALNLSASAYGHVNREHAAYAFCDGLTPAEALAEANAWQAYQTALGRNV